MGLVSRDDGWRIPDWLWERLEALLPPRPAHPLANRNDHKLLTRTCALAARRSKRSGATRTGGRGVVSFAGWNSGGSGYLVVVRHRLGFESWYAHLSRIASWRGEPVTGGTRLGDVGSTGRSTGPHLHFEVRLNGTPVDPRPRLLGRAAAAVGGPAAAVGATALRAAGPVCDRRSSRTC